MGRLLRLLFLGGLIAAAWTYLRKLLADQERPLPQVSDIRQTVEGAARTAASSVSSGGNGTADLSKAELYREAQKLDVEGRSKMSKDELADAVARARRGGGS